MKRLVLRSSLAASLITALLSGFLSISAGALATKVSIYPLRHALHCRPRYAEVERKGQHKCLLTSGKTRKLGAFAVEKGVVKLDPSFTQAATDPLDTIWSYSVAPGPGRSLPKGVLSFRLQDASGQSYECAINAGGSVTGSTCEIELPDVGKYTTIVEFESGSISSVETESATVYPFPAHAKFVETTNAENEPVLTVTVLNESGTPLPPTTSGGGTYQIDLSCSINGATCPASSPLVLQANTCTFYTQPESGGSQTAVIMDCIGLPGGGAEALTQAQVPSAADPSFPVTLTITLDQNGLNEGEDWPGYALSSPVTAQVTCTASGCSWSS